MNKANDNILENRYEILEQVGIGGMSYVYKAYDQKTKKIVAIKVLKDELSIDEDFVKKFKSESLASKNIKHKNVVRSYDVVDKGNLHYIVMEFIDGITLNNYIKKKGKLTNEETIDLSIQIASGLSAAHNEGIVHRDIKPQNIVINTNNEAKITDFGIARAISSTTRNVSIVGTVHYISPEQARNETIDYRSDIYSLGCTMYEMITGKTPFVGDSPVSIVLSHIRENIKEPHIDNPDIYKGLEKIILKCTRMIPKERYQTAKELIEDLKKVLKDKDGNFITDDVYGFDEGKTVVLSTKELELIKAEAGNKYIDPQKLRISKDEEDFLKKYIKDRNAKRNLNTIILIFIVLILIIVASLTFIYLANHNNNRFGGFNTSTNSIAIDFDRGDGDGNIVFERLKTSLPSVSIIIARNLVKDYGINIVEVRKEFSDEFENGEIIEVLNDDYKRGDDLNVVVSKGKEVIDFTDLEYINSMTLSEFINMLDDRDLKYFIVEVNDNYVERGKIIGINKKLSTDPGDIIVSVSKGYSSDLVIMPDLYNKTYDEAKTILAKYSLGVGRIIYMRDLVLPENYVIKQSIEKGTTIAKGADVDLTISTGLSGIVSTGIVTEKWKSELKTTYVVNNPKGNSYNNNLMTIQVRLMQYTDLGVKYFELTQPTEYVIGTTISLIYPDIEGEPGIETGLVQVIDVINDVVLNSYKVVFKKVRG